MRFADDLAERRGLDREWVRQAIGQARLLREVPRLVLPPPKGQPKNWAAYRARFVEPVRIRAGLRFWQDNAETLARAEKEYGVPAEIIVGIIGVETIYGQHMGGYRVIDALATLAFDFPDAHPRAARAARLLPARAGAVPVPDGSHRHRPAQPARQLRRRHGPGPVHAIELVTLGGGL